MPFKKLLIAVDNSSCSMHAAKKGFDLARGLDIPVGLIYVVDHSYENFEVIDPEINQLAMPNFVDPSLLLKQAEETLDQIIHNYNPDSKVLVEKYTPEGFLKEEILQTASKIGADAIILGTHGRKGIAHFLMGNLAEYILRHSTIPVIVVPEIS